MRQVSTKPLFVACLLFGLIGLATLVTSWMPAQAHHLLLLIAVALIAVGASALHRYRAMADWIEVPARLTKIIECEEVVSASAASALHFYYPEAEYEYSVNGETYHGDRVGFDRENYRVAREDALGDHVTAAQRWWLALRPGQTLPAFVNPRNASEAVLVKSIVPARRSHHLAQMAAGVLLALLWMVLSF